MGDPYANYVDDNDINYEVSKGRVLSKEEREKFRLGAELLDNITPCSMFCILTAAEKAKSFLLRVIG